MREILFRGKRLDNGGWVEGYYAKKTDPFFPDIVKEFILTMDENSVSIWNIVDPATVGQYTGLTDKNGVKIFEGDILKFQFHDIGEQKAVVVWDERYAMFSVKPIANFQYAALRDGTVIGNIYDNPELLKEES